MFSSTPSFSNSCMTSAFTRARWISTPTLFISSEELARNGQVSRVFLSLVASLLSCFLLLSRLFVTDGEQGQVDVPQMLNCGRGTGNLKFNVSEFPFLGTRITRILKAVKNLLSVNICENLCPNLSQPRFSDSSTVSRSARTATAITSPEKRTPMNPIRTARMRPTGVLTTISP